MINFETTMGAYTNKAGDKKEFIALACAEHGRHALLNKKDMTDKTGKARITNEAMIVLMKDLGKWQDNITFVPEREFVDEDGVQQRYSAYYFLEMTKYTAITI